MPPGNQWRYCCGNGNGPYRKLHEDVAYRIGQKRLRAAADLGVDTIPSPARTARTSSPT